MLTVGPDPVVVEQMLADGLLQCPDCAGVLARWGHVARRFVRHSTGAVEKLRLRPLSEEGGCGRTHVLLPAFLLGRRLDVVEVIWWVLRACVDGLGWRRLVALVGRPASTVRGWDERRPDGGGAVGRVAFGHPSSAAPAAGTTNIGTHLQVLGWGWEPRRVLYRP